ncbi:MAG: endonuclease/exonuclease/phosphatase family protein [Nocardioides sp.]|uniref:endonuclease/exonuclease/phosphatase family protein n=1 Tax=Nocardioides sp. TaxID=35761 RepID=UPI0039E69EDE
MPLEHAPTINAGTWNIGKGSFQDLALMATRCDLLGLQEASDQAGKLDRLAHDPQAGPRFGVWRPHHEGGQAATPVIWDRHTMELVRPFARLLYDGGPIGKGTGPDHGKPKWLVGGIFLHRRTHTRVAFGNLHCYAGQKDDNKRQEVSAGMVERAGAHLAKRKVAVRVLVGDFNALPNTPTTGWLRAHNWSCDQLHHRIGTHRDWSPDHVWWKGRARFFDHYVRHTESDHHGLVTTLELHPKGRS